MKATIVAAAIVQGAVAVANPPATATGAQATEAGAASATEAAGAVLARTVGVTVPPSAL